LRAFRELDDALLQLRVNHLDIGVVVVRAEGELDAVLEVDRALSANREHWLANEILRLQARVLRRFDLTSRSFFALIDQGTCFGGALLELALASDRVYMLEDEGETTIALSELNAGAFPMSHGLSRLEARFLGDAEQVQAVLAKKGERLPTSD